MSNALVVRDTIVKMVRGLIDRERPKPRVAEVYTFDRFTGIAEILLPGETLPGLSAKFPSHLQPTRQKKIDGSGDVVLVEGTLNNYRITQILSGDAMGTRWSIDQLALIGGKKQDRQMARFFSREVDLPGAGASVHLGRFYFLHDLDYNFQAWSAYVEMVVQSRVFFGGSKSYKFAVDNTNTTPTWKNIFPNRDSGFRYGNDFDLEIFVADDHSFELRVRNVRSNGTAPPQGYTFSMWLYGQDWEYDDTNTNSFDAGVSPGVPFRTDDVAFAENTDGVNVQQGPFFMPIERIAHGRSGENITGGGTITWSDKYVKWSNNLVSAIGRSSLIQNGIIQIPPPVVGQSIYYHAMTGGTLTVAATANGIDMLPVAATHSVLYYAPDYGSTDGANGRYHVVGIDMNFKVPSHWIMIAVMNQTWDYLRLGTGHTLRPWQKVVQGELVNPSLRGIQSALVSLATSGSFQTITNWTEQVTDPNVTYSAGVWTFNAPGSWDMKFMMTTASNATGGRAVRINKNNGTIIAQIQSKAVDTSLATGVFIAKDITMAAGETIRLDGMQSSGGALNTVPGENFTYYSFKRTGP